LVLIEAHSFLPEGSGGSADYRELVRPSTSRASRVRSPP
jgi:hypothetical protein